MQASALFSIAISIILFISGCSPANDNENNNDQVENASIDYFHLGDSISNLAQQTLLMEVSNHLQSDGVVSTLKYCNVHALTLLDSVSKIHQVNISRISAKNRNPNNKASNEELVVLDYLNNNKKDTIIDNGSEIVYYKTIRLGMPACIKCHGVPEKDISLDAVKVIDSLYPSDLAKNYSFGDFRGAWKIQFKKE